MVIMVLGRKDLLISAYVIIYASKQVLYENCSVWLLEASVMMNDFCLQEIYYLELTSFIKISIGWSNVGPEAIAL